MRIEAVGGITVDDAIPTRESLLGRLKDRGDDASWRVFFDTYWRLIYGAAVKAGLSDMEAQDVVQETVISVCNSMPKFQYDRKKGSFKHWLMKLTGWRIVDQMRKRDKAMPNGLNQSGWLGGHEQMDSGFEETWDLEWETNLLMAATERVRKKVDPWKYQIFDLYAIKGWPVTKVARTLKTSVANVYVVKARVMWRIEKEMKRIRKNPI